MTYLAFFGSFMFSDVILIPVNVLREFVVWDCWAGGGAAWVGGGAAWVGGGAAWPDVVAAGACGVVAWVGGGAAGLGVGGAALPARRLSAVFFIAPFTSFSSFFK